ATARADSELLLGRLPQRHRRAGHVTLPGGDSGLLQRPEYPNHQRPPGELEDVSEIPTGERFEPAAERTIGRGEVRLLWQQAGGTERKPAPVAAVRARG